MSTRREYLRNRRKKAIMRNRVILVVLIVALVALCGALGYLIWKNNQNEDPGGTLHNTTAESENTSDSASGETSEEESTGETGPTLPPLSDDEVLNEARQLAAMYDYDAAIAMLQAVSGYESKADYTAALQQFEEEKAKLVKWTNYDQITHVFFHTLIVDAELAFGSAEADKYNQVMTTVDEFNKMMQSMYDQGYVLVGLHDISKMEVQPDGSEKMVKQEIWLPEGKKPFVLSEDDVCYYEYMTGSGFATKLVIGDDGKVTNEYINRDGTVVYGSYDVPTILEDFIEEHPDFSYRGAKGIIAVTGYNGVFGYRTSDLWYSPEGTYENAFWGDGTYAHQVSVDYYNSQRNKWSSPNVNIEEDKQKAREVAEALKAQGWELASHSWGHPNLQTIGMDHFKWDTDMWEREVETIIGETDIILFPVGADVGLIPGYTSEGNPYVERYEYLKAAGFNYFCNVDSTQYFVQYNDAYFRQGRRNLDGTRMYQAILSKTNEKFKDRLSDLFDVESVWDQARPMPVQGVE